VQSLFSLQHLLQWQLLHLSTNSIHVSIPCYVVKHQNLAPPNAASSTKHLYAIPQAVSAQTSIQVLPPFPIAPIASNPYRLTSPPTSLYSHKFVPTAQMNVLPLSQDILLLFHAIPLHVNVAIMQM